MGKDSAIQWTDNTFNPWMGCVKVSEGCKFCYAETTMDKRLHVVQWGAQGTRIKTRADNWRAPHRWNREAQKTGKRRRVFCASLADVFEDNPQLVTWRAELFGVIEQTPFLDWQLLTKRPENILRMIPESWAMQPLPNVWFGTSVENQAAAEKRLPDLLAVPAHVRFLSCEPLLGAVQLGGWLAGIHWVITGGESGRAARPATPVWFRSIRDECQRAGVAYFHKQNGGRDKDAGGELLDGATWHAWPGDNHNFHKWVTS